MAHLCKECGYKAKSLSRLCVHIGISHGAKKYYDKFLKKEGEGTCKCCGKPTSFRSLTKGYSFYCCSKCSSLGTVELRREIFLKKYNVDNPSKLDSIKKKKVETCRKNYNVDNPSQSKVIKKKKVETCRKNYNVDNPSQSKVIKKLKEATSLNNFGYKYATQSDIVKEETKNTCRIKYNTDSYLQYYRKNNNISSEPEKYFRSMLRRNNIKFRKEYNVGYHNFDFAILDKNKKLRCLIEIDGEFFHGISCDCDGRKFTKNIYKEDYLRWKLVPNGVKFLIIDSQRLNEGFEELKRILPMSYKKWKKEMLRSIPRNIEDAIPEFSEKRMLDDWKHLRKIKYNRNAFLCKSILLNFVHSHWKDFDWKSVRKTLYKSPCSEHHLLEGLDNFKNPSELREKFRIKYRGIKEVTVKHHSPEKMLAICSLGKTYISREKFDKESIKIIKFLGLKAYQF